MMILSTAEKAFAIQSASDAELIRELKRRKRLNTLGVSTTMSLREWSDARARHYFRDVMADDMARTLLREGLIEAVTMDAAASPLEMRTLANYLTVLTPERKDRSNG